MKSLLNGNPGSTVIDAVKIDGAIITDPAQMAHAFNGSFSGIGHTLAQKIPQSPKSINDYLNHSAEPF